VTVQYVDLELMQEAVERLNSSLESIRVRVIRLRNSLNKVNLYTDEVYFWLEGWMPYGRWYMELADRRNRCRRVLDKAIEVSQMVPSFAWLTPGIDGAVCTRAGVVQFDDEAGVGLGDAYDAADLVKQFLNGGGLSPEQLGVLTGLLNRGSLDTAFVLRLSRLVSLDDMNLLLSLLNDRQNQLLDGGDPEATQQFQDSYAKLLNGLAAVWSKACTSMPPTSDERAAFIAKWQTWFATRVGNTVDAALMALVVARGDWPDGFLDGVMAGITQAEGLAGPDYWHPYSDPSSPGSGPRLVVDPEWVFPDGSNLVVGDPLFGVLIAAAAHNPKWFYDRFHGGEQVQVSWDSGGKWAGDGEGGTAQITGWVDKRLYDLIMKRGLDPASFMALFAAGFSSDMTAVMNNGVDDAGRGVLTDMKWVMGAGERDARIHDALPPWQKYGHDILGWAAMALGYVVFLMGPETWPVATASFLAGMGLLGAVNAAWYFSEGDWVDGALSLLFVVPIGGQAVRFTAATIRALKAGEMVTVAGIRLKMVNGTLHWVNNPFAKAPGPTSTDIVDHLTIGKYSSGKTGVVGGHEMDAFYQAFRDAGIDPDAVIVSKTKIYPGVYNIEYNAPKMKSGSTGPEDPLSWSYTYVKTVYDPAIVSTDDIVRWGNEAMKNAQLVPGSTKYYRGVASNGWTFEGILENGVITTFYPVS